MTGVIMVALKCFTIHLGEKDETENRILKKDYLFYETFFI